MKKVTYLITLILALAVTACGSRPQSNSSNFASSGQNRNGNGNATGTGALPVVTQIALGTLKLDKSANDITSDQAVKLLPLWETLQLLETSDTAAKQEIDALDTQIQETMTAGQMQAITSMNLTRQDMFAVLQAQGGGTGTNRQFGFGNGNPQSGNSSGNGTNRNRNFGGGGGFFSGAGGPPDGGGFGGGQGFGGQNRSASQIATAQAARQANGGNRIPAPLVNALIEFLKKKAGS